MRIRLTNSDAWLLRTRTASLMAIITALLAALYVVVWVEPVLALIVPVAGAALPLAASTRAGVQRAFRWAIAIVALFIAAGAMTIGPLFVPTLIALIVGCAVGLTNTTDIDRRSER